MKEYDGHVGLMEGSVLIFSVLAALLFVQVPQTIIAFGGPAGWQVILVATLLGLLLLLPVGALAQRFPGLGLAEISRQVAGPFFGPLFTLAVTTWLGASTILTLRSFTETFVTAILPQTPPSVIIGLTLAVASYASYKGVETIARTAQVLLPLILLGILLVLGFSLPRMNFSLLFPFWGRGVLETLNGGVTLSSLSTEAIILLSFGYAFREGKVLQRCGLYGILAFGLTATVTVAVLVGILGSPTASQNPFPLFSLARLIYLGRFLQRMEAILVMFWVFAALLRISALLHATCVSLAGALSLPAYRPLLFPLAPVIFALSLLPEDFVAVLRANRDWIRPAGFLVLAIPLLLLLIAILRKQVGKEAQCHEA